MMSEDSKLPVDSEETPENNSSILENNSTNNTQIEVNTNIDDQPIEEKSLTETTKFEEKLSNVKPEAISKTDEQIVAEKLNELNQAEIQSFDNEEETEDEEDDEDIDFENIAKEYSKEQIVEQLEQLVENPNINEIKSKVGILKSRYLSIVTEEHSNKNQDTKPEAEKSETNEEIAEGDESNLNEEKISLDDSLQKRFDSAFYKYKSNNIKFNELLEKQKLENVEKKNEILDELRKLIDSEETLKKTYDEFKELQEKWKAVGPVPRNNANELWANYHFLIEKFFDKVKINKELKDLDLKKNLEYKINLCEKAEDLLLDKSYTRSFKILQNLHEEWKTLGPVASEKRDEIWDRFKLASDKINQRRRDYFESIKTELEANYAAKLVLCDKVGEVLNKEYTSHKQWIEATDAVNEIFKMWKNVGRVPNKVNEEIWTKFKSQIDTFYSNKKEFYNKISEEQLNNYNLKLDLCVQAETLSKSEDWKNATQEILNLQKEWKNIGSVPRKFNDKVWKRFRTACDDFFNAKKAFYQEQSGNEEENLKIKNDLLKELSDLKENISQPNAFDTLKDIQRRWMEVGFVPFKSKSKLQSDYKELLDYLYDHFRADNAEYNKQSFKERISNYKNKPEAVKIINKEQAAIQHKIDSLKEEIMLWENNIGFFTNSKQSNLYKAEYEKKISNGKAELAELEEKLKIISKSIREEANKEKENNS